MQTTIASFSNPFSFFCKADESVVDLGELQKLELLSSSQVRTQLIALTSLVHGQYVAVYWKEKWVRGIVSMESRILIWLVDYGFYFRPLEKTICVPLAYEFKKIPSDVFEAGIHGVIPIDKKVDDQCEIKDITSTSWNLGAIEKAKKLIDSAIKIAFVPVALLTTNHNDIVLGDLYLDIPSKGYVNIIDELELWPVFLQKNSEDFIKNLPLLFTSRRQHRACPMKPNIPGLAQLSLNATLQDYKQIVSTVTQAEYTKQCEPFLEDGSTVVGENGKDVKPYKGTCTLSPDELEEYANMNVTISGQDYNLLHLLVSKARDFDMCKRYEDHDLKGCGRGYRSY